MQAIILSIGDELVLGQTVDTNSAYLSARLASLGIGTLYHQTLADDRDAIAAAIRQAAGAAQLVLISGGIGPTEDDLTRQALADAMNEPLVVDQPSLDHLQQFFDRLGRPMAECNRVQAMRPRSSAMIPNDHGTAPGLKAPVNGSTVYVTPGVPREMQPMYEQSIEPELRSLAGGRHVILTLKLNTFGTGESTVAQKLGDLMDRRRNPKVGTTVADGIVAVRLRSEFATVKEAKDQLDATVAQVLERLGPIVFGREQQTLQESVVALLEKNGKRLVTAESCTGGLIAELLTQVGGSSAAFLGGWVTYSNVLKMEQLGVPKAMLDEHGAVSDPVARAMAEGALTNSRVADVSLSVTGIAGPDGGSEAKPVGTVWLGMSMRREDDPKRIDTTAWLLQLHGDRQAIRDRAAKSALQKLRLAMMEGER